MIRKVSIKRAAQNKEYSKLRLNYFKNHPICEVGLCGRYATDIHHIAGRIGNNLTDITNFLAVCRQHHCQIEENPIWAKEKGYSKSRLAK